MWPVATDVAYNMVCVLGTWMSCAKTAEQIEIPFWRLTRGPKKPLLDRGRNPPREGAILEIDLLKSLCCSVCSKRDQSSITTCSESSITAWQHCCSWLQCSWLVIVTLPFSPMKNPPACDVAFRQNSLTTCWLWWMVECVHHQYWHPVTHSYCSYHIFVVVYVQSFWLNDCHCC